MTISPDELAELARAATPGPWRASTDERYGYFVSGSALDWIAEMGKTNQAGIDADFIAACDPATLLKLLAVVKAAKAVDAAVYILPVGYAYSYGIIDSSPGDLHAALAALDTP